jgi:3-hydroxyacyl-CoA dehydrogenase
MTLNDRLENVTILGAAGKMGSGIALLLAQEMTLLKLQPENKGKNFELNLIDVSNAALEGLLKYLKAQSVKLAERNILNLRELYADSQNLIENHEIIQQFVDDLFLNLHTGTDLSAARNSLMVFEAIVENPKVKISLLSQLKELCPRETYFFTNTSSIPIKLLDDKAGLNGRIIGYHFYNPPAVQKLVELITPDEVDAKLKDLSLELGKRLRKKLIPANDIAGFIGNGHFMRDGLYAISEADNLKKEFTQVQAIYIMNRISQEFLVRPMGIFQLIDYVGIDVFKLILSTMNPYFPDEDLESELINLMVEKKVLGGQNPDGSQKEGFLKYEKNRPIAVFDPSSLTYNSLDEKWRTEADQKLGNPPEGLYAWKMLLTDPQKEEKLAKYFSNLKSSEAIGAQLAIRFLQKSKSIGEKLVTDGVASSPEDVNGVLLNGFYHLYGPVNNFV